MASTNLDPLLISSLGGEDTLDGFYFLCAFSSLPYIDALLTQHDFSQNHLNLGLKAAYHCHRADIATLLLERGADAAPLLATIGLSETHKFLSLDATSPQYRMLAASTPSEAPDRQIHHLRLSWVQLRPHSRTLLTLVEGADGKSPTVCHLQAYDTRLFPGERIAWMEFDLAQSGNADHIDRIAHEGNIEGTPLHWTVDDHVEVWKNVEILEFLVRKGADVTKRNRLGQTPREVCVEMLALEKGAVMEEMRAFYEDAEGVLQRAEREREREGRGKKQPAADKGLMAKTRAFWGW